MRYMSTADGKEGKLKGNVPVERTRPDLSISREAERSTALEYTHNTKNPINKKISNKQRNKTYNLKLQRLQRPILRRRNRIQPRLLILLRPRRLHILLERIASDIEKRGSGVDDAGGAGKNERATVGD